MGELSVCERLGIRVESKTQLTYICTVVSDEIRTAINFNGIRTVANALHKIKEYLNMAVMPLTLQQLNMLRYKPPAGQSQTVTTQSVIQMFCKTNCLEMAPKEILVICMLNTIQDKNMMIKVQEHIMEYMPWEEVRNVIVKIDRAAHLSDVYCQNNRMHISAVQSKACRACGKKGHMSASCSVPKIKLNCKHCDI